MKKITPHFWTRLWLVAIAGLLLFGSQARAQSWVAQAQQDGFTLKKVVSDTLIDIGQNFTYTIYFTIPAGATGVTISDVLPAPLEFQGASVTSACGAPVVSAPSIGTNGTYSVSWASTPSGCSGSFSITVRFPNGTTCNGTTVRNRVCVSGKIPAGAAGGTKDVNFCTPYVNTVARAVNPWHIGKWVSGAAYQGGACAYATGDSVISYQVCVYKDPGTTGQLNLVGGIVRDTLPAGAVLQSSSCGAVQSGNVITWTVGNVSALPMYNTVCCTFTVLYPRALFPNGSTIQNMAWLSGSLGGANQPCGPTLLPSNKTCVEIKAIISGTLGKYAYTNGQPGCSGFYRILMCNNGTVALASLTIRDTIPVTLTSVTLGTVSSGLNATLASGILTITTTSALLPGQCRYVDVNFTIPAGATVGSTITNCAWMTGANPSLIQSCASFIVNAPAPKPCLWKEVCNKQPQYAPGAIFRYRLRIQNIGGQPISGATLTDVLNPNLQYWGSPSYYTSSTWNTACTNVSNWAGVTLNYNAVTNTVTATLPTIAASCQQIFYGACGMYGTSGIPYYFVEFDVKVRDTAALGNIPNAFSVSGGTVVTPEISNTDYVTVAGTVGFTLDKGVKKPSDPSYSNSTSTSAGSSVAYRLRMIIAPGSVGLRYVTFADLLPLDNGVGDNRILSACGLRGSQFNIGYASLIGAVPAATQYNKTSAGMVDVDGLSIAPLGALFNTGCGTDATPWSAVTIPAGAKNFGFHFGATPIGGSSATAEFNATVAASAQAGQTSCNTFAANGAVRHLINSNIISDQIAGALESGTACVTVTQSDTTKCLTVKPVSITNSGSSGGNCTYTIVLTVTNPNGAPLPAWFNSLQGTVTPGTLTLPVGASTQTFTFTDTPPANSLACIRFGIYGPNQQQIVCDSVCFDLTPCSHNCLDSLRWGIKCLGVNAAGNKQYTVGITGWNGNGPGILVFSSPDGTFAPASQAIPAGSFSALSVFTDLPPANSLITIYFGILGPNGQVICRDSIKLDLPPCPQEPPIDNCCEKFIHSVVKPKLSYNNAGGVFLSATLIAGPSTIKRFSATIVSVQMREVCKNVPGPWQRSFGDIVSGSLVVAPGAGPQLLQIYSRQVQWGPVPAGTPCVDWNNGASLNLKMIYPPVPTKKFCHDTLVFAVRYSFTDCECRTCDTIKYDTLVRNYIYTPWDNPTDLTGIGGTKGTKRAGSTIQAAAPDFSSIVMQSDKQGTLWVVNPAASGNNIVVKSVEMTSPVVGLKTMTLGTTQGAVLGNVGFIPTDIAKGSNAEIALEFDNPNSVKQFPVDVRYGYTDDTSPDQQYTDIIRYTARVPGVTPDQAGVDPTIKPQNVRTYVLYFSNRNGYSEDVAALRLHATGSARIMAVGPVSERGDQALVIPQQTEDGTYIISASAGDKGVLSSGETIKPIYMTVSDIDSLTTTFTFESLDRNGEVISRGSFILTDPLSGVAGESDDKNTMSMVAIPNPANASTTLSFRIDRGVSDASLTIYDTQGSEVARLLRGAHLEPGNHVLNVNTSALSSGMYYITLQTSAGSVSQPLSVVR